MTRIEELVSNKDNLLKALSGKMFDCRTKYKCAAFYECERLSIKNKRVTCEEAIEAYLSKEVGED